MRNVDNTNQPDLQLSKDAALQAIDALTAAFFRAFDNRRGPPAIATLAQLVLPAATVIQAHANDAKVWTSSSSSNLGGSCCATADR